MCTFRIVGVLGIALGLLGCSKDENDTASDSGFGENKYVVKSGEFTSEDPEIAVAIQTARESFGEFIDTSMNPESNGVGFVAHIMTTETTDDIQEAGIQVSNVEPKGKGYHGIVSNYPVMEGVAMGDQIEFELGHLVEWMYVDEGKVIGAQVTRVLRSRMSPAELKAHDEAIPFEF